MFSTRSRGKENAPIDSELVVSNAGPPAKTAQVLTISDTNIMSALRVSKQNCTPSTGQVSAIQNGDTERCIYYNDSKSSCAFPPTDRRRIQTLLELNPSKFKAIYSTIRSAINRAGFDPLVEWHHQPSKKISRVLWIARDHHPYLSLFERCWPAEELIKHELQKRQECLQTHRADFDNATLPDLDSQSESDSDLSGLD